MQEGPGRKGTGEPRVGDLVLDALKGIRSEILLYGIVVIIIVVGSARFGIAVLQALEIPLLVFATIVLLIYFFLVLRAARNKVTGVGGKGSRPR